MKPVLAVGVGLALAPAPAWAQNAFMNDPKPGSPSGTVYEIPFEAGRRDAAPRHTPARSGTHTGATSTGGSAPSSSIRSDNGFGSSGVVPGAGSSAAGKSGGSRGKGGGGRKARRAGGGKGASTRRSAGAATSSAAEGLIQPAASSGTPSLTRALLLLGLGVVVAVALGLGARRASRGR